MNKIKFAIDYNDVENIVVYVNPIQQELDELKSKSKYVQVGETYKSIIYCNHNKESFWYQGVATKRNTYEAEMLDLCKGYIESIREEFDIDDDDESAFDDDNEWYDSDEGTLVGPDMAIRPSCLRNTEESRKQLLEDISNHIKTAYTYYDEEYDGGVLTILDLINKDVVVADERLNVEFR